jgi:hypothetical protein
MGQKSLLFSVNKCIPTPFNSTLYHQVTSSSKFQAADQRERYTTSEIRLLMQRFAKAVKISSRKESCLRKVAVLNNAFKFAKNELKCRQEQRLLRWKELKPLFHLESMSAMADSDFKMASIPHQMAADESMEFDERERPSTPLPSFGAVKRNRCCECISTDQCTCETDESHLTKKFRHSPEEDDLKSLDQFLSSLHCNSRQVVDWQSSFY